MKGGVYRMLTLKLKNFTFIYNITFAERLDTENW